MAAECVSVRRVRFASIRRIPPGTILDHSDGLAIVAAEPHRSRCWLDHDLLYLSGEEYRGSRDTAERILRSAVTAYSREHRDEISVTVAAHF